MAKTLSATSTLALDGGPQAVTAPIDDRWERVTDLERSTYCGSWTILAMHTPS